MFGDCGSVRVQLAQLLIDLVQHNPDTKETNYQSDEDQDENW